MAPVAVHTPLNNAAPTGWAPPASTSRPEPKIAVARDRILAEIDAERLPDSLARSGDVDPRRTAGVVQKARVKPPLDPAKREFTTLLKIEPNE